MIYILVEWLKCQYLMEHKRFDECYLVEDSVYMCPKDLWSTMIGEKSAEAALREITKFSEAPSLNDFENSSFLERAIRELL